MKIKIKDNAKDIYIRNSTTINWDWATMIEQVQGMTLEVETEFLYGNQYNTGPIEGVSEQGMRIMDNCVEAVIDDARLTHIRCDWCGKVTPYDDDIKPTECAHCKRDDYIEDFSNAYFVKQAREGRRSPAETAKHMQKIHGKIKARDFVADHIHSTIDMTDIENHKDTVASKYWKQVQAELKKL